MEGKKIGFLDMGTQLQGCKYRYYIEKVLGQGSFGITYLARVELEGSLGALRGVAQVAIKEFFMKGINGREKSMVTHSSRDGLYDDYKRKFIREVKNLSRLDHPNIVKVLESFEANNTAYYVMEYVDGESLNDRVEACHGLSESESLGYLYQIGEALSYMHTHRMLHLDVKPSNVMLRKNGEVVLIDFGLSKQYGEDGLPESSTTIGGGTPSYAPLEQSHYQEGEEFPVTMDVYALGATLFKTLTGKRPPEASVILNGGFPAHELQQRRVSDNVISCIAKAMAPFVRERYGSVAAFVSGVRGEETEYSRPPEPPEPPKPSEQSRRKIKRKRTRIFLVLAGIVMIGYLWNDTTWWSDGHHGEDGRMQDSIRLAQLQQDSICQETIGQDSVPEEVQEGEHRRDSILRQQEEAQQLAVRRRDSIQRVRMQEEREREDRRRREEAQRLAARSDSIVREREDSLRRENDPVVQYNWGHYYYASQDYDKAVECWRKAAELGHVEALCALGDCWALGRGVSQDDAEAAKWYRKAAEQGDAKAQYNLGVYYERGQGVLQDNEEAAKWYRKAAEQGDATAQHNLGVCYERGQGVLQDNEEAAKWYQKAAEQGDVMAQNNLGVCYEKGQGVSQNYAEAVKWYRKAAEQGFEVAQNNLGVCYMNGNGVPQNYEETVKWCRKAAIHGYASAQYNLGLCYHKGLGVSQDYAEAVKWYRKAADQGFALAQLNLGICYAQGLGVSENHAEAEKWLTRSAEQGNVDAKRTLGIIRSLQD